MKKIVKGAILAGGILLVSGGILFGGNTKNTVKDVTAPYGKLIVKNATNVDNVNYVTKTSAEIEIVAADDTCEASEIKYYFSTEPISDTEKVPDNLWKTYADGTVETVTLPSLTSTNKFYAIFKDKYGNTSKIYTGSNFEKTITYNANGGSEAPVSQTVQNEMPAYVTNVKPKPANENEYFLGWSTDPNATDIEYYEGDLIPASELENNITLYAVYTTSLADVPTLAEKVEVGDYVNYPVYYDNLDNAGLNGWRVISKDIDLDGNESIGTVNLVSAGIPLTYYKYNASTAVTNLTTKFLTTSFSPSANDTYRETGFNPYVSLQETFTNKYTLMDSSTNMPKVRAMTKKDLDRVYGSTTSSSAYVTAEKFGNLLAIPTASMINSTSKSYVYYWLASANSGSLWAVSGYGSVYGTNGSYWNGVRPVVSLKSTVKTTGTDMSGAWNIEIE